MTRETIRLIEWARKLSDSEWEIERAKLIQYLVDQEKKDNLKTKAIEKLVYEFMTEIGMPTNINGYTYISRAIAICMENGMMLKKITSEVYHLIAKEFNTTPTSVETAIRYAIFLVYHNGNEERIHQICGITTYQRPGRPSNSKFITGAVRYLSNK